MTLVRGAWYNHPGRPVMKAAEDLEQGDLAACAVRSEDATSNLRYRTYTMTVDKKTASSSEGWSSSYVLWQPDINLNLLSVTHHTLGVYENATCDNFTLYKNACTSFGHVALKTVSTGVDGGTRTEIALSSCVAITAGTPITLKGFGSTCSAGGRSAFIFGYESTA